MKEVMKNLIELIKFEKSVLNPIRFKMNFVVMPIYLLISAILFVVFGVLMSIDDIKYLPIGLALLGVFVLLTAALLITVPFTRKKELETELSEYDFDTSKIEESDKYDFSTEEATIIFDKSGLHINDDFYWYNHTPTLIYTENSFNRVNITILFRFNEEDYCGIPLNGKSLKMLEQFDIKLQNPEVLEYILNNKEQAFEDIYKGKL